MGQVIGIAHEKQSSFITHGVFVEILIITSVFLILIIIWFQYGASETNLLNVYIVYKLKSLQIFNFIALRSGSLFFKKTQISQMYNLYHENMVFEKRIAEQKHNNKNEQVTLKTV